MFSGWLDDSLDEAGRKQARHAGHTLLQHNLVPQVVHVSALARAQETAREMLRTAGCEQVEVHASWLLNERHYRAWQGVAKYVMRTRHGDEQYREIRRSRFALPPAESLADHESLIADISSRPSAGWTGVDVPWAESLDMVSERVLPYWRDAIEPDLAESRVVLVVAHSNSLRALIMLLEGLGDEQIAEVNVPLAMPLVFDYGHDGVISPLRYLEPDCAAIAAAHVACEGATPSESGN